jgi:hypothetical protein
MAHSQLAVLWQILEKCPRNGTRAPVDRLRPLGNLLHLEPPWRLKAPEINLATHKTHESRAWIMGHTQSAAAVQRGLQYRLPVLASSIVCQYLPSSCQQGLTFASDHTTYQYKHAQHKKTQTKCCQRLDLATSCSPVLEGKSLFLLLTTHDTHIHMLQRIQLNNPYYGCTLNFAQYLRTGVFQGRRTPPQKGCAQ